MKKHIALLIVFLFLAQTLVFGLVEADCGELKNNECSEIKPIYCRESTPVENCTECGCDEGWKCNSFTQKCLEAAEIEIEILSENGSEQNPFKKREGGELEFRLLDSKGKKISKTDVLSIKVSVNEKPLELRETKNSYFANIEPVFHSKNSAQVLFEVEAGKTSLSQLIDVFFENEKIELETSFEKKLFEGEIIGKIKIKAEYEDKTEAKIKSLVASIKQGDSTTAKLELAPENIFIDYAVTKEDSAINSELELNGTDSFGNDFTKTISLPLEKRKNPVFSLEINPITESFSYCSKPLYTAKILSENPGLLENPQAKIKVAETGTNKEMEFDPVQKMFYFSFDAPCENKNIKNISVEITASAEQSGQKKEYVYRKEISLASKLQIEFVKPKEGIANISGNSLEEFEVELSTAPGEKITPDLLNAVLTIDNETRQITLEKNNETGNHTAKLEPGISPGEHIIELSLRGELSGNKAIHTTIRQNIEFLVLTAALIALLLLAGFVYHKEKCSLKEQKEEAKRFELAKRKRMLKDLKFQYYKRRISESEYKKKTVAIKNEIGCILKNKEIAGKKNIKTKQKPVKKPGKKEADSIIERRINEIKKRREKGLPL